MILFKKVISFFIILLFFSMILTNALSLEENINDNKIIFDLYFSKPIIENSNVDGNIIATVTVEDLVNTHNLGNPILPIKPVRILLSQGTELKNVEVSPSEKIMLGSGFNIISGGYVVPVSQNVKENNKPEISTNSFNSLFSYIGVYSFRGFSILNINLHPIQYDASNGEISYYKSMWFKKMNSNHLD